MNSACIIGNLTKDPELRHTTSGLAVTDLRVAVNTREKSGDEWVDRVHYFDVTVWGGQAENACTYLAKGKKVGVTGSLRFEEWESDDGGKRSKVKIVARDVEFLTPKGDGGGSTSDDSSDDDFSDDDDIPF